MGLSGPGGDRLNTLGIAVHLQSLGTDHEFSMEQATGVSHTLLKNAVPVTLLMRPQIVHCHWLPAG